jgi:hypothetical protein
MHFMLLIYADETKDLPSSEIPKLMEDYRQFTEDLFKSGCFRAGGRLQQSSTARVIRERDGERTSTSGPVAPSKDQLGGYYIVECDSLDQAAAIAGLIPGVRRGEPVEIRPLEPIAESPAPR